MLLGIHLEAVTGPVLRQEGKTMADKNYKYTKKYDTANTTKVSLKLNKKTDADIIEYLDSVENKQGTIKRLIREEISRRN